MKKISSTPQAQAGPWIYNPWLDLIVGCGAWSAPLLLISYFSVASSARTWSVLFYALALFFNYPHYMATIYRAYHRAEDFQKYRVFTVHITALVVLTLLLSHYWLRLLPWIFTLYLTWSPWHYTGQNYGLFMMFARRAGANPDKSTRRALYSAFILSYLILFLGFNAGPSQDPLFLSLGLPPEFVLWEQVVLTAGLLAVTAYAIFRLTRELGWRSLLPSLTLLSSQFLWFLIPTVVSLFSGLAIPQNRYSSGVLAVMHSAQYLWITSYYAHRESAASTESPRDWKPFAYFGVLVLGGIALFIPGPWLASRAFHHDFTASFLIFTALINVHHFILDGAIWKLRDGRIAALLLNSRERITDAAAGAGGSIAGGWRWLTGTTAGARYLRVSATLLLLLWGTVDQVRFYLATRSDDLHDLQRAAALNSFDSSVQMQLAKRAANDGDLPVAEAAMRRAMQSNPNDPGPRQALLKLLVSQERYGEAFTVTEAAVQQSPKDANLLLDRGMLALRTGHPAQAVADWNQTLALDPHQSMAHLYLADEFDREGKATDAAAHYDAFLERVAKLKPEDRPAPDQIIAIVMRMADCQARSFQSDRAIRAYQLAEKLAVQTGKGKLESVADVNEADLQSKVGGLDAALRLYQRALQLDKKSGDGDASAQDWLAYGRFLNDKGFSVRLAYACLVKAESLTPPAHSTTSDAIRGQIEKQLGATAAAIRRDPEPALQEALVLRR